MNLNKIFLFPLILAVGMTACTTIELRDANKQLTNFYSAKMQAKENNDWAVLGSTIESMNLLAQDAAMQAEKEKGNIQNRISFYRIAATAAWQAGNKNAKTYAEKGSALCEGDNYNSAPRDCGMLMVIPYFASVDEITNKFQDVHDKIMATEPEQRNNYAHDAEAIFNDYQAALISILDKRPQITSSMVHPDFITALDYNTGKLLCDRMETETIGLIATAKGDRKKCKCEVYKLKLKAFDVGLRRSCVSCLDDSRKKIEEKEPQDCN